MHTITLGAALSPLAILAAMIAALLAVEGWAILAERRRDDD